VFTLAGAEGDDALVDSLVAGIAAARDTIVLRRHEGVHPRIGAADVVPLVPIRPPDMERACAAALALGRRIGDELGLPVFLYGEVGAGRRPAFFRRGGPDELQRRIDTGELEPDFGPRLLDAAAGGVLVGARKPLVAFNMVLETDDVEAARAVAAAVRESGGGLPGLQARGVRLASTGRAQVSMNLVDLDRTSLHEVVERVVHEAAERGVAVASSELVGLVPAGAVVSAARTALGLPQLEPSRVLELNLLER
jgi:glutamate formiminotransferase